MPEERNLALFIDFDNIAIGMKGSRKAKFEVRLVLDRLLEKGRIITKRAYADWKYYDAYKAELHAHGIELTDIPKRSATGKNSADIRLVVDAMDLCHTKAHLDTFVILSGDSDFSPLVSKLRENDKVVVGIGLRESSSSLLVDNCDEFIFYENLGEEERRTESDLGREKIPQAKVPAFRQLVSALNALLREDIETLSASLIKDTIKRKSPSFDESTFGYKSFSDLLEDAQKHDVVELSREKGPRGSLIVTKLKGYKK